MDVGRVVVDEGASEGADRGADAAASVPARSQGFGGEGIAGVCLKREVKMVRGRDGTARSLKDCDQFLWRVLSGDCHMVLAGSFIRQVAPGRFLFQVLPSLVRGWGRGGVPLRSRKGSFQRYNTGILM